MGTDTGSTAARGSRFFLLAGGVTLALLQVLQTTLPSFSVRPAAQAIIVALIGLIAAVLSVLSERAAQRDAQAQRAAQLDDALACWPLRTPRELSAYDLGSHHVGATSDAPPLPYVAREDAEREIREGLTDPGIVVIYGPPRAGKSRTAYEVVAEQCRDARVIAPEDANGLRTLLAHADALADLAGAQTVLWLDELPRFLPTLELDAIDRLVRPQRRRGWLARALDRLPGRRPRPLHPMRVVATLRVNELQELLGEGAADADATTRHHRMRRLLARARAVPLEAPDAGSGIHTAAGDLPAQSPGWRQARIPPLPPPAKPQGNRAVTGLLWGLIGLTVVLVGVLVWYGSTFALTEPKSTSEQIAKLVEDAPDCERLDVAPHGDPKLSQDDLLVVVAHRALCSKPDELRLYRLKRSGRLRRILALSPPDDDARVAFKCAGVTKGDHCHVSVEGKPVVVGSFVDLDTHQALPVALRSLDGELELAALAPRPPPADAPHVIRIALRRNRRPAELRLSAADLGQDATATCHLGEACLRAPRAETWAALTKRGSRAALLIAGYLSRGRTDLPRRLAAHAWRLSLRDGRPVVRDECWIFARGHRIAASVRVSSFKAAGAELALGWQRAAHAHHGTTVC
jgi:hypothetical protein